MVNLSKLRNDPDQQARGYLRWLRGVSGYYYIAFIHEYHGLTAHEMKKAEPLLLSDIKEYYSSKDKGYHLKQAKVTYDNFQKTVAYYVKLGIVTKGKATLVIEQIGNSFNLLLVFATRSKYGADAGQPNTFRTREPNLSLYKDPSIEKSKRRLKNRVIRKKEKANLNAIELNKVHTSDVPRHKKTRRKS